MRCSCDTYISRTAGDVKTSATGRAFRKSVRGFSTVRTLHSADAAAGKQLSTSPLLHWLKANNGYEICEVSCGKIV